MCKSITVRESVIMSCECEYRWAQVCESVRVSVRDGRVSIVRECECENVSLWCAYVWVYMSVCEIV